MTDNIERALQQLEALADSVHEVRLRLEAKRMGCSFTTRAKMEQPDFVPGNTKPWQRLDKRTRKCFDRSLASMRPRKPLSADERKQLSLLLGFTTR